MKSELYSALSMVSFLLQIISVWRTERRNSKMVIQVTKRARFKILFSDVILAIRSLKDLWIA